MLLQSCACWSRKGRMTGSDRRCIRPLTIARSLASRKPWRAVDGGGLDCAGGMTGLDRRGCLVCVSAGVARRLGEMSEVLLLLLGLSGVECGRRLLLLLLLRVSSG